MAMEAFREFLNTWLAEKRWSANRLAEEIDVSQSLISRWLSTDPRKRIRPTDASLRKLAPIVGRSQSDLMRMVGRLDSDAPVATATSGLDPRLAQFLTDVETGWRSMDDAARDMAERTARALFHVEPVQRRRVTKHADDLGRPKMDGNQPSLTRRTYQSQSVASQRLAFGFQPA